MKEYDDKRKYHDDILYVYDLLKEPLSTKELIFLKEKNVNVNHVFDKTVQFHITNYKNN